MADEVKVLEPTEKMKAVLKFLQANEGEFFCAEIAEAVGAAEKSINPVLTAMVKRGYIAKTSRGNREVADKNGNPVTRDYQKYAITETGLAVNAD